MTMTIRAVYQGGVLRPVEPLGLPEGETVDVTIAATKSHGEIANVVEIAQRLKSAKTIGEWVQATRLLPSDDGGYDILKALNENRIWSGERPLTAGGGKPS